jgi:hypothetical protein
MNMKRIIIFIVVLIVLSTFLLTAASEEHVRVKVSKAYLRQAPNTSAAVVGQVPAGTVLLVLEKRESWYKVTLPAEGDKPAVIGYIRAAVVEPSSEPARAVEKKRPAKLTPAAQKKRPVTAGPKSKKIWLRASYLIGFDQPTADFTGTQAIYHENATLDVQYKLAKANLPNLALGYRFSPALGVELGVSFAKRDLPAAIEAGIPHPLQFDHFRTVNSNESLSLTQMEISLGLVYTLRKGNFGIDLTVGPVMVQGKTDLVAGFAVAQDNYPYSTVSVTYDKVNLSKSAFGFFAGAGVFYYFGSSLGIGADVRYVSAAAKYEPIAGQSFSLKLGGLRAGVGIKFFLF